MNLALFIVPAQIERVWPDVLPYLNRVDDYHLTLDDFKLALINGDMQLWLGIWDRQICCACITHIMDHQTARVLEVLHMGGDGANWPDLMYDVEAFARSESCTHIEIKGRPGWAKIFTEYTELYRTFSKELTDVSTTTE